MREDFLQTSHLTDTVRIDSSAIELSIAAQVRLDQLALTFTVTPQVVLRT